MKKKISIVIPIYNEEANIPTLYKSVMAIVASLQAQYDYELILVNDGSRDQSWPMIADLALQDSHITALNFSRNFGHQMALTAGYDHATGDAIITMDADMQDTPSLILEMIAAWQKGADIVYARRANRKDTFLKRITAYWYYKLLDYIADVRMPRNVGDFRLIDKKVLVVLQTCRERSRYLRGMVAWTGFNQTFVDFDRPDRLGGQTGYTWSKMIQLAFDGVTGFSLFPLRIAAFVGMFVIASGTLMFGYITVDAIWFHVHYPLFKWLVTLLYIFMGVNFLLLWILGEYLGRVYEQQKGRPLYIIKEKKKVE